MSGGAEASPVRFFLNGEERQAPAGARLLEVLAALSVDTARIAVEHDRRVVPRAEQAELLVTEGAVFEVVQFVGGG